ncbi:MAG: hypothetical protein JW779_00160 [Candidatus Thorarchaeota archaeon]|nr:hypothetical protein [Candidatus Thorarchaeota archaeon]
MTYRHKRDSCVKETKDIIENILQMTHSDYELTSTSEVITSRKSVKLAAAQEQSNIIHSETEAVNQEECITVDDMEEYEPCQHIDFEISEVKEVFEKKKKKRNYIEFRPDYGKME